MIIMGAMIIATTWTYYRVTGDLLMERNRELTAWWPPNWPLGSASRLPSSTRWR